MAEKNGTGQKRCRERERRTERKEKSGRQERQCYGSRKFLELMVHNKRMSVPKLIMSVHAGLISFPAFNKYVAMVIRHNFSTRRDLVREHRHVYTRECANTVRVNLTRESTRKRRERERDGGEIAHAMYYVDIRWTVTAQCHWVIRFLTETLNRGIMLSPGSFFRLFLLLSLLFPFPLSISLSRSTHSVRTHTDKTNAPVSRARDECVISPRTNDCPYVFSGTKRTPRLEACALPSATVHRVKHSLSRSALSMQWFMHLEFSGAPRKLIKSYWLIVPSLPPSPPFSYFLLAASRLRCVYLRKFFSSPTGSILSPWIFRSDNRWMFVLLMLERRD